MSVIIRMRLGAVESYWDGQSWTTRPQNAKTYPNQPASGPDMKIIGDRMRATIQPENKGRLFLDAVAYSVAQGERIERRRRHYKRHHERQDPLA